MDYSIYFDGNNGYTIDMTQNIQGILSMYNVFRIFLIVIVALEIFSNWNIFKKAGEKTWKSIIPFYNYYTMYKVMWNVKYFWISAGLLIVSNILVNVCKVNVVAIIALILMMVLFIIQIVLNYKMAKKFGHGILFTIGLVILYTIFKLILALDNSEYINEDDVIVKTVEVNHKEENNN